MPCVCSLTSIGIALADNSPHAQVFIYTLITIDSLDLMMKIKGTIAFDLHDLHGVPPRG